MKLRHLALAAGLLVSTQSQAISLLQAYEQAKVSDPTYQAASKTLDAAEYTTAISRATLLPQLSGSANTTYNNPKSTTTPNFNTHGFSLTLKQTIFDWSKWKALSQSYDTVKQATVVFTQAQQDLITRVSTAYFNVLEAHANLSFAKSNQKWLKQQLEQAELKHKVGLAAITDVQVAKAQYQQAIATTAQNENNLNDTIESLMEIIGARVYTFSPLKKDFPLVKPDPANESEWVKFALENNLTYRQQQLQVEIDKASIGIKKAGYLPTVSATGSYTRSSSRTSSTLTNKASLDLAYNLFSGFATKSAVDQADYTAQSSTATLEKVKRETISQMRQTYLNVISDISQVKALKQAVISGESSLKAMRAAYSVGTSTIVDLLRQQSNLFDSQQKFAQANYKYILDTLALKQVAGTLSIEDVKKINALLTKTKSLKLKKS